MSQKLTRVGPLALTNTYTTNIYNQGSALIYDVIRHIHVANKTAVPHTFRLFLGATGANAAGTELFYDKSVPAGDVYDWFGEVKLSSTEFLVGGADAATSLTIEMEGEQFVA